MGGWLRLPFRKGTDTVLGPRGQLQGTLVSHGHLRIEGEFRGRLESGGRVVLGPEAAVVGEVRAESLQVAGLLRGSVQVGSGVEILPGGRVWADIEADSLKIHEGAFFEGQTTMRRQEPMPEELALEGPDAVPALQPDTPERIFRLT